jgi:hypothetical protein
VERSAQTRRHAFRCVRYADDLHAVIVHLQRAVEDQRLTGKEEVIAGKIGPTKPEKLKITQKSGDSWVSLANGTYLIPETDNEGSRRHLDFMFGDAKSFDT